MDALPETSISLTTELNRYGAIHAITSTIPDVFGDEAEEVRDVLVRRHAAALKTLTAYPMVEELS